MYYVPMYIDAVPNRNSPPAILLRKCWREGKTIRKKTVANMTHWPSHVVEAVRRAIKGEKLVALGDVFAIERSLPHGHVEAVLSTIRRLGLDSIIASKKSRQRDLVIAMIAQRLIRPYSKLATTRHWHDTTLAREMAGNDPDSLESLYRDIYENHNVDSTWISNYISEISYDVDKHKQIWDLILVKLDSLRKNPEPDSG